MESNTKVEMRLSGKSASVARVLGRLVALALAVIAVIAILGALTQGGGGSVIATGVTVGMLLGAVAYLRGLERWTGPTAARWRRVGWLAMAGAAAVPSSLSIVLVPLAILLVPTLLEADQSGDQAPTAFILDADEDSIQPADIKPFGQRRSEHGRLHPPTRKILGSSEMSGVG